MAWPHAGCFLELSYSELTMVLWNKVITSISHKLGNMPKVMVTQLSGSKAGNFFQVSDFKSIAVLLAVWYKEENMGAVNAQWTVKPFARVC